MVQSELSEDEIKQLNSFLTLVKNQVYPEPVSKGHANITRRLLERLFSTYAFKRDAKVLDVGCGQGVALEWLSERTDVVGITLSKDDIAICRQKQFSVMEMDQSFLEFPDNYFDLVWCRHCLEHSVFPYFTLLGFNRVIKPDGFLYVEVPAPDTVAGHTDNPNHYSVLGKSMWLSLLKRSGFSLQEHLDIGVDLEIGKDIYWSFTTKRAMDVAATA